MKTTLNLHLERPLGLVKYLTYRKKLELTRLDLSDLEYKLFLMVHTVIGHLSSILCFYWLLLTILSQERSTPPKERGYQW